jgi:hypothetical protein
VIECDDVDRAGIGVGLQRDESLFIADDAHLSCDLVGRRIIGHRDDERPLIAAARVNSAAACGECQARRRTPNFQSGHDVLSNVRDTRA